MGLSSEYCEMECVEDRCPTMYLFVEDKKICDIYSISRTNILLYGFAI